jgi:hypothetical protein
MRKRVHIALAVVLVILAGVIAWRVLRPQEREPVYRSLEVRLQRLTNDDTPPGDFLDKLRWMVPSSTQAWTAVFEIRNPWGRTIGVNQMMRDAVIVDRDSRADASYAGFALRLATAALSCGLLLEAPRAYGAGNVLFCSARVNDVSVPGCLLACHRPRALEIAERQVGARSAVPFGL